MRYFTADGSAIDKSRVDESPFLTVTLDLENFAAAQAEVDAGPAQKSSSSYHLRGGENNHEANQDKLNLFGGFSAQTHDNWRPWLQTMRLLFPGAVALSENELLLTMLEKMCSILQFAAWLEHSVMNTLDAKTKTKLAFLSRRKDEGSEKVEKNSQDAVREAVERYRGLLEVMGLERELDLWCIALPKERFSLWSTGGRAAGSSVYKRVAYQLAHMNMEWGQETNRFLDIALPFASHDQQHMGDHVGAGEKPIKNKPSPSWLNRFHKCRLRYVFAQMFGTLDADGDDTTRKGVSLELGRLYEGIAGPPDPLEYVPCLTSRNDLGCFFPARVFSLLGYYPRWAMSTLKERSKLAEELPELFCAPQRGVDHDSPRPLRAGPQLAVVVESSGPIGPLSAANHSEAREAFYRSDAIMNKGGQVLWDTAHGRGRKSRNAPVNPVFEVQALEAAKKAVVGTSPSKLQKTRSWIPLPASNREQAILFKPISPYVNLIPLPPTLEGLIAVCWNSLSPANGKRPGEPALCLLTGTTDFSIDCSWSRSLQLRSRSLFVFPNIQMQRSSW